MILSKILQQICKWTGEENKQTNRAPGSFPCHSASQRLRFFLWAHKSSGSSREVAGLPKYWSYTLIQTLWEMQASGISAASCNSSRQEPKLPLPFLGTWSGCLRYSAPGNRSFFPESEERMDYFLPSEIVGCILALVGGSQLWRKSCSRAMHQNLSVVLFWVKYKLLLSLIPTLLPCLFSFGNFRMGLKLEIIFLCFPILFCFRIMEMSLSFS